MKWCALLLAACSTGPALSTADPAEVALPIGAVIARQTFGDGDRDGRGDNFSKLVHESGQARGVRYAVDGDGRQRIAVSLAPCGDQPCGFGDGGDGRASLIETTREATPGQYYKAWMAARTADSTNNGSGMCEDDSRASPGREQFRAQLKIWFLRADGGDRDDDLDTTGSCYCNVCPREGGAPVLSKCNTAQWAIDTTLSDDGACKAPPGTTRVRFAVTALARDRQPDADGELTGREASGTAVFDRYVFARCSADGVCDAPAILDATAWY